ncbi:S-DNA-T family DNA segregation ATPase FtsK/SpoIIIE [Roseovarius sp. MBR-78]|uniref:DNA translocase FtsK n=1 Tax=Roseovarius sp. MBR-78 TaxID=3156460 RepID=UPI003397AFB5
MAYQTRGREPLLDSSMTEALGRRGKELVGLVLIGLSVVAGATVVSYAPSDPSWMAATDGPVHNWLGAAGASVAAPLYMIIGLGAWALAILPGVWGVRLMAHMGGERAPGRLIFAPLWVAILSLYCATLAPSGAWSAHHSFGLGGLFGDTVLGTLLGLLPVGPGLGLRLSALGLGVLVLGAGAFVLGFDRAELRRIGRFLLVGVILCYAGLRAALAGGMRGAVRAGQAAHARGAMAAQARAERRATAPQPVPESEAARPHRAEPRLGSAQPIANRPTQKPTEKPGGLLARMPALMRKPEAMPEPELIETGADAGAADAPPEDRIRARISDVIRARGHQTPEELAQRAPLTKGRGRGPDPLIFTAAPRAPLPPEPPLTSARLSVPPAPMEEDALIEPDMSEAEPAPRIAERPRIPVPEPRKVVQHAVKRPAAPSARAQAEAQPALPFGPEATEYELPPLSLLSDPANVQRHHLSDDALEENARMLENVLDDYGVKGEIVSVRPGPVVTMYELEPAPGLKASRVIGLADDIARSMAALSARVSTVPGRSVIGIELPNDKREMVSFREILSGRAYGDGNQKLPLALGKDIGGEPMVANLAKMPHLLIAGTTGSGKSVAINTMILSLLYKLSPDECRLIMIDPKMLELSVYDGIPHLLSPVVTDPKKAVVALKWVVAEMEDRYRKMSKMGVRNIDGYNGRVEEALSKGEMFSRTVQTGFDDETGEPVFETDEFAPEKMPYIVVIVDEMADLMMVAGKEIEACIQRLAQMARASGIHLIMATQRPSVDVITGTIKANFPTRISFQVTSKIDSRTILGEQGAEQLLGMGDMLYMAGGGRITRCHAPFVSDEEVEEVVSHLKAYGPPAYVGTVLQGPDEDTADAIDAKLGLSVGGNTEGEDALYDQAVAIVAKDRKCSTSYIQRKLAIGYNKAARLVEQMEDEGVVSGANHVGKREVLVPEPQ